MSAMTFSVCPAGVHPVRVCPVCGCRGVDEDEVEDAPRGDRLTLAECPRCKHRWTARSGPVVRAPRRVRREVASAA